MSPGLALSSTLIGSNYPCLEHIFMVPKVFEPLKFDCIFLHELLHCTNVAETETVLQRGKSNTDNEII